MFWEDRLFKIENSYLTSLMAMILNNFFRDHNLGATKLSDTKPRRFNTTTKNSLTTDLDNKYKKEKY